MNVREMLSTHREVPQKLDDPERGTSSTTCKLRQYFDAIPKVIQAPAVPKRGIGFRAQTASGSSVLN